MRWTPDDAERVRRILLAVASAGGAAAPRVQDTLARAYGQGWLEKINHERREYGKGRGLHDYRFVLALVAYDPALTDAFVLDARQAAKQLIGLVSNAVHFEPL